MDGEWRLMWFQFVDVAWTWEIGHVALSLRERRSETKETHESHSPYYCT